MRAARLHGRHDLRVDTIPEPGPPGPDEIRVAPLWCGVCGSACPSGAIDYPLFHDAQILAEIDALAATGGA